MGFERHTTAEWQTDVELLKLIWDEAIMLQLLIKKAALSPTQQAALKEKFSFSIPLHTPANEPLQLLEFIKKLPHEDRVTELRRIRYAISSLSMVEPPLQAYFQKKQHETSTTAADKPRVFEGEVRSARSFSKEKSRSASTSEFSISLPDNHGFIRQQSEQSQLAEALAVFNLDPPVSPEHLSIIWESIQRGHRFKTRRIGAETSSLAEKVSRLQKLNAAYSTLKRVAHSWSAQPI